MTVRALAASAISLTLVFAASAARGDLIQLTGGSSTDLQVRGTDDVVDFVSGTIAPLPSGDTLVATGANASAAATYAYSANEFVISDVQYSLGAANEKSTFAQLAGQLRFTPLFDVTWELGGQYSWQGDWANGVGLFARITDVATEDVITLHYYDSAGVLSNVSYTVGVGVGNVSNEVGPTTGTLQAGREYLYYFVLSVDNNRYSPDVGAAVGDLSLTFVPEPSAAVLLVLGVWGLRRRRRRA